jgi:hypothetical protein
MHDGNYLISNWINDFNQTFEKTTPLFSHTKYLAKFNDRFRDYNHSIDSPIIQNELFEYHEFDETSLSKHSISFNLRKSEFIKESRKLNGNFIYIKPLDNELNLSEYRFNS